MYTSPITHRDNVCFGQYDKYEHAQVIDKHAGRPKFTNRRNFGGKKYIEN